ncbi:MAG: DUF927 domain-containing protein [Pseudomonadales bacterium]|nr:DUF927 domain-containing protein [Pseudomonadales bacterium]
MNSEVIASSASFKASQETLLPTAIIPKGYQLTEQGVFEVNDKGEAHPICGPLWLDAKTRDLNSQGWGMVLHWIDQDGIERKDSFPVSLLYESRNSLLVRTLADRGLKIVPRKEKALLNYVASIDTDKRLNAVRQTGWHQDPDGELAFILPGAILSNSNKHQYVFQPDQPQTNNSSLATKGTLTDWQTHIGLKLQGNPLLIFAVCAAFAAPLLKFLKMDCTGFHFYGQSSQGKTTTLQVAASVWGNGQDPAAGSESSFIQRWNTTGNALEAVAANHNDILLTLDEMATCSAKDFGNVIYNLAGGQGKARLSKDSDLKSRFKWLTLVLSSGEISVKQKIEESGQAAKAGQLNRMIDIECTEKIIQNYHDLNPSSFVNYLKQSCANFHGIAGISFLQRLLAKKLCFETLSEWLQLEHKRASNTLAPNGLKLTAEAQRAISRFAVVLLAGKQATELGVLPLSAEDIDEAILQACNLWLGNHIEPEISMVLAVRDFITRHGESHFWNIGKHLTSGPVVRDCAGYYNPDQKLYIFTDEGFMRACNGNNPRTTANALRSQGLLFLNDGSRSKSKHQVPDQTERARYYAVRGKIKHFEF